jgi:D-arabinose 5-phosphate isomerase GutQ
MGADAIDQLERVFRMEGEELVRLASKLDYGELAKARELIRGLRNTNGCIFFTGCGTSAQAAKKIAHTFDVIEQRAFFLDPADAAHGGLGAVHVGDIVVFISKGGRTLELTSFLPNVKKKGARIIALGESSDTELGRAADIFLHVKVEREPDEFNMLATSSTLATIAVFDAIAISLMGEENFSKDDFLINHPGGDVGLRLANRPT